jgi:hypothetical protein
MHLKLYKTTIWLKNSLDHHPVLDLKIFIAWTASRQAGKDTCLPKQNVIVNAHYRTTSVKMAMEKMILPFIFMKITIPSVHPEMVGCGSDQGCSEVETRRRSLESEASVVAALCRGFQPSENAELGRKMPFMDGHYLRARVKITSHFRAPMHPGNRDGI